MDKNRPSVSSDRQHDDYKTGSSVWVAISVRYIRGAYTEQIGCVSCVWTHSRTLARSQTRVHRCVARTMFKVSCEQHCAAFFARILSALTPTFYCQHKWFGGRACRLFYLKLALIQLFRLTWTRDILREVSGLISSMRIAPGTSNILTRVGPLVDELSCRKVQWELYEIKF